MLGPNQPAQSLRNGAVRVAQIGWNLADPNLILENDGFAHVN